MKGSIGQYLLGGAFGAMALLGLEACGLSPAPARVELSPPASVEPVKAAAQPQLLVGADETEAPVLRNAEAW